MLRKALLGTALATTTGQYEYFRLSLPAGRTVTALLDGLTVDYDMDLYNAAGDWVGFSYNDGSAPEQASWTNTSSSATNVYVAIYRPAANARTTYQLRISY